MNPNKLIRSDHYKKQAAWFTAINTLWQKTYPIGTKIRIDKDALIKNARRRTALHDLGKDFWDEPLERLIRSINTEAELHPMGRFITKKRLENLLSVRLRAEKWFKKHPEILEQAMYPVTVIVGLQRSGTTKLHRLLASDPDTRAILSWEALNPAPINGDIRSSKDRIKMAKLSENALKIMSPGFFAIHPVEHLAPEEDVLLLDTTFMSTTAEAIMHVPSYASWLEQTDQSMAYEYMGRLMKLLQWQNPAKRWVLKTPHHLEFMPLLDQAFEDVRFVWTHRNVHEAIPSFLSMVAHSRILFSKHVDSHEVAKHWVRKIGYMLDKALEYRTQNSHKITDVLYENIVLNSQTELNQIYKARGLNIDTNLSQIFDRTEKTNTKGKYGIHRYRHKDFGIDEDFINRHTQAYQGFQNSIS